MTPGIMSALTSLLVRDRVVSVSKIEEALQQQVLFGGDIETILLELNLVPEDVLSAYRAALYGLLPATRDEVMHASREARAQMPAELARTLGVVPILFEGRALVLAAAEPLGESVSRQLRAQLACEISVRIVTQVRLAAGLSHHYGLELDARTIRLVDALRKREPGVIPYVRPPSPSLSPSMRPLGQSLTPFAEERDSREMPALDEPPAAFDYELGARAGQAPQPAPQPPARAEELAAPVGDSPLPSVLEPASASSEPVPSSEPPLDQVPAAPLLPRDGVLAGFQIERATTMPPNTVSPQLARALRGPVSLERAKELLGRAAQRDDVLFVLLRYAQQFFDFVAIFSIGKEGARGRMAHGAGLSQELMEQVVIPIAGAGLAARTLRDKRPLVGDLGATDEERAALTLLGRPAGRPGLAIPVTLGARVALLVYADRVGEGLAAEDADPVAELGPAVGEALRRLILEQKTLRGGGARLSERPSGGSERPGDVGAAEDAAGQGSFVGGAAPAAHGEELIASARGEAAEELSSRADAKASGPHERMAQLTGSAAEDYVPTHGPGASAADDGLTAIDLHAVSRWSSSDRRRPPEVYLGTREPSIAPEAREAARGRLPGVPRSAPPPPLRDSGAPPSGPTAGSYSMVATSGAVLEETVRPARALSTQPIANALREAREAALAATPSALSPTAPQPSAPSIQHTAPLTPVEPERPAPAVSTAPTPALASAAAPALAAAVPLPTPEVVPSSDRPRAAKLSLVAPEAKVPSVIIDMGEQVDSLVDQLMRATPNDPLGEIDELLKLGEGALPVLMQYFPGPLWFDPKQAPRRRPRGRDVSAIARAIVAFGERAAPYLASKLTTSEPDVCRYALMVAGEIVHPDLLDAVARRAFDANDALRSLALEVLRRYAALPQFETVLRAICDLSTRPGKDARRQRIAVEALAELRDSRALRALIARLSDTSEAIAQSAHRALVVLTGQDLGSTPRRWESWAEQVAGQHRVEWLIDGLSAQDEQLRALASEELKQLTQQYFGYHPGLPKRDRELAQRKYREWWESEGRAAFKKR